jgi:hypothetical protein
MTWSYQNATATARQQCRSFGNQNGSSRICGAANDPKTVPLTGALRPAGANIRDATAIEASDSVSFVVFEASGVRLVQRPASGIAIFEWQATAPATRNDFTARAYDADGQLLGCVASGTRSC